MNEILGVPAHPLFVHLPVVLLPLAMVGVVIMLVRPGSRRSLLVPTALVGLAGAAGALMATISGDWLEDRVRETAAIENHADLGEMARNFAVAFAVMLIVWAARELLSSRSSEATGAFGRLLSPAWVGTVAVAGSLLFGTLTTVWIVRAGHTGAESAWDGKLDGPQAAPVDGEYDEER